MKCISGRGLKKLPFVQRLVKMFNVKLMLLLSCLRIVQKQIVCVLGADHDFTSYYIEYPKLLINPVSMSKSIKLKFHGCILTPMINKSGETLANDFVRIIIITDANGKMKSLKNTLISYLMSIV